MSQKISLNTVAMATGPLLVGGSPGSSFEDWRVGGLEGWRVGRLEGWRVGRFESWRIGRLNGCRVGGLEGWRGGLEGWRVRGPLATEEAVPARPPASGAPLPKKYLHRLSEYFLNCNFALENTFSVFVL